MSGKDVLLSSLLQKSSARVQQGALIQEVDGDNQEEKNASSEPVPDAGPTMLEMMMAAQAEARKEKEKEQSTLTKKSVKTFGEGFKKGFFSTKPAKDLKSSPSNSSIVKVNHANSSVEESSKVDFIPTISKSATQGKKAFVLDEVQSAMKEEEHPALRQVKQGGTYHSRMPAFV